MKITKENYKELKNKLESLEKILNGGKGSGNFGHAGRQGKVGGSSRGIGAGALHQGTEVPDETTRGSKEAEESKTFEFAGGDNPDAILNIANRGNIMEATGCGSKYTDGIRLGYGNGTISPAPFAMDDKSKAELDKNFAEQDEIQKRRREINDEKRGLVEGQGYKDEKGWDIHYYADEAEISGSNMSADKKKQFKSLIDEDRKLLSRSNELYDKQASINRNAEYYPKLYGTKGALLAAGLAVGVGEYLGQRSDGAGESSFNDRVQWSVDRDSMAHTQFLKALSNPISVGESTFNLWRDASAKLASSQAAYLKRVETSISDKNFLGSEQLRNVAQTIKKMSYSEALADLSTSGNDYVSFASGKAEIKKIGR